MNSDPDPNPDPNPNNPNNLLETIILSGYKQLGNLSEHAPDKPA